MKNQNLHKNKGGFKMPQDYLESFNDKLFKEISINDQENSTQHQKKGTGFKVPENYFDKFDISTIKNQGTKETKPKVFKLLTKTNIAYITGIAAMIAIILSISINNKQSDLDFNDIQIADIYTYFNEENVKLSTTEIASLLGDEVNFTDSFSEEIPNENVLLEYLSEEDLGDAIIFEE